MFRRFTGIIISALFITLIFSQSALCEDTKKIGISIEPGKYDRKRLFYENDGKKLELKVEGEYFIEPQKFMKTADGRSILFVDSLEENKYDSYVYIYDIEKNKTGGLLMRNVRVEYVHRIEWFDTHSFLIKILAGKYLNFTIGQYGPFYNGSYLVKFNENHEVDRMNKIEW